jgi:HPr kinase/phosphorylase
MGLMRTAEAIGLHPDPKVVISTGALASDPELAVTMRRLAGEGGLGRPIRHPRVQKSGLALAGHSYGVVPARVQILGETELSYLDSMSGEGRTDAARSFFALGLSCVVVTGNREPPKAFVTAAEATDTPLYVSESRSSHTINALHAVLDDRLAPQATLHGVLLDVFGIGVLLLGKSGIGKSECALELVLRGHRLVADDIVRCDWRPPGIVFGSAANLLRHHIEARGLGVLNVKALFGVTSVRDRKSIDIVVRLVEWDEAAQYDRLGVEDTFYSVLETPIRELTVPVRPGRDMGSILEVAARNELLRRTGSHAARDFMGRLERELVTRGAGSEVPTSSGSMPAATHSPGAPRPLTPRPPPDTRLDKQLDRPADRRADPRADPQELLEPRRTAGGVSNNAGSVPRSSESSAWIPAVKPREEDP